MQGNIKVQTAAKYQIPQRWQILPKQFLEASDLLTAYNRGKVLNCGRRVLI